MNTNLKKEIWDHFQPQFFEEIQILVWKMKY